MQNFTFVAFALFLVPASLMALQCYETTGTLSVDNLVQVSIINQNQDKEGVIYSLKLL